MKVHSVLLNARGFVEILKETRRPIRVASPAIGIWTLGVHHEQVDCNRYRNGINNAVGRFLLMKTVRAFLVPLAPL